MVWFIYLFGFVSEGIFLPNTTMHYIYLVERNSDYGRVHPTSVDTHLFTNILRGLMPTP